MTKLRITDLDGKSLAFDLRELLGVLGDEAMQATWRCDVADFVPIAGARYLPLAYDSAKDILGAILYQIAAQTLQIIAGTFVGTRAGVVGPWVILQAVDSSWWDVTTEDEAIEQAIARSFRSVECLVEGTA